MGRDATKAMGNVWYEARKEAAIYNDRLASREGAAEMLGMSVSAVADAELGLNKCMPADKAVLMADLYRKPQLLNYYCKHECPIGCRHALAEEVRSLAQVTVEIIRGLRVQDVGEIKDMLLDIAADGVITEDEKPQLEKVVSYLEEVAKDINELKIISECALNGGRVNGAIR